MHAGWPSAPTQKWYTAENYSKLHSGTCLQSCRAAWRPSKLHPEHQCIFTSVASSGTTEPGWQPLCHMPSNEKPVHAKRAREGKERLSFPVRGRLDFLRVGLSHFGGTSVKGDDRGWGGWVASLIQWTWVWVNSGSWWWTGRPGVLQSMGSQRVRQDWATELNWTDFAYVELKEIYYSS